MSILINRCYHWVSYHLIDALITEGHSVVGINDTTEELDDHLSMFLGRNSLFVEGLSDSRITDFESAFIFGDVQLPNDLQIKRTIQFDTSQKSGLKSVTVIKMPLLFGKWMPMNEKGIFHKGEFISFESERFHKHAIYIGDFIQLLQSWLTKTHLPSFLTIYSANSRGNREILLENSIYIHDNIPIMNKLENVLEHYRKFKDLYPQHNI